MQLEDTTLSFWIVLSQHIELLIEERGLHQHIEKTDRSNAFTRSRLAPSLSRRRQKLVLDVMREMAQSEHEDDQPGLDAVKAD